MGANMRGVALICSALFLLATGADAQPRLKRDDTAAPAQAPTAAAAPKKEKAARPGRAAKQEAAKQAAPVVDSRPRLKRDDTAAPATVATPAAPTAAEQKGKRHSRTA